MSEQTTEQILQGLRKTVAEASKVPMSASCMMNRVETLAVIDRALESLREELAEAERIRTASSAEVLRGKDEGDRIRIEAEEWASQMASQTEIVHRAKMEADRILTEAREESEALKSETDKYIDQRMAEFEAVLAKTSTQVGTMRRKLAARSGLDGSENTQLLPRL